MRFLKLNWKKKMEIHSSYEEAEEAEEAVRIWERLEQKNA